MPGRLALDSGSRDRLGLSPRLLVGLALACVVAYLAGVAHLVLVRHVRCAAHGDLIHASEHPSTHADRASTSSADAALMLGDGHDDEHDHDHCDAVAERRPGLPWAGPAGDCRSPSALVEVARAPDHAAPSFRALYALAPKTSPPV